jgi:hypothetical protein
MGAAAMMAAVGRRGKSGRDEGGWLGCACDGVGVKVESLTAPLKIQNKPRPPGIQSQTLYALHVRYFYFISLL